MNINQFQISNYVKKQIDQYLADHETTLRNAMDNEQQSRELAASCTQASPNGTEDLFLWQNLKNSSGKNATCCTNIWPHVSHRWNSKRQKSQINAPSF